MQFNFKNLIIIIIFSVFQSQTDTTYNVGDSIMLEHQNISFDICYGANEHANGNNQLSLSEFNGNLNGGNYHVMMFDIAASWWEPCFEAIGTMAAIEHGYSNNPHVKIITILDEIGQPYSCNQWAAQHQFCEDDECLNITPIIIDDGLDNLFYQWFNTGFQWPSTVFIDHNMNVYSKGADPNFSVANFMIDQMLDECGGLCDLLYIDDSSSINQININQNYPNPFNPSTTIDYFLPNSSIVKINVYDIYGNIVDDILNDFQSMGYHSISWAPEKLSSGIYLINITQNKISENIKVIYIK